MLLTLSVKSVWSADRSSAKGIAPLDLPKWAREELGVYGLTLQTSLLAGWDLQKFDRLRDAADKASAPCLVLVEDKPLALAHPSEEAATAAIERAERVLRVAARLGCSSVAISLDDPNGNASAETLTPRLKAVLSQAEKMELNLLLGPSRGITQTPDKLTGLIRKVGGFRIGSFPDFAEAARSDDPIAYLRSLVPYASCVCATVGAFDAKGKHKGYDLGSFMEAIESVGYEAALTLDFKGTGDPIAALQAAKSAIESFLAPDVAEEEEDEDQDLDDPDEEADE